MRVGIRSVQAICISLIPLANAQLRNWLDNQINTSICAWDQPRAALVRNTVYLDGGAIWWSAGLANGQNGKVTSQGNYQGVILSYNFTEPFSRDTNVTGILMQNMISKARGGGLDSLSTEPNYYDGGMLANDAEFYLYGGAMFRNDDLYQQPAANAVFGYRLYNYGPDKPLLPQGFIDQPLSEPVTRYIAYGGAVNAPSENLAWYFSGLTSQTRGPIFKNGANESTLAMNVSNTLISLDTTTQLSQKWYNTTLPNEVKGRANAEVVWIPVGKQGILVVIGGVVYPEWATPISKSENETASNLQSKDFMRLIDIFDVSSKKWYQQPTTGGPEIRTRGCAVVAPASDYSSFNIYYYGGFDGIHQSEDFSDEVWVLSVPSFTWTLINKGTPKHGRSGHKCFTPYPDQMMVFGGSAPQRGSPPDCLDQGPVVIFNLTSGEWMSSYSPTKYAAYGVHHAIISAIGGDASGHATATKPASGWVSNELENIFSVTYDKTKLKKYWPYTGTRPVSTSPASPGGSDSPSVQVLVPAILVPIAVLLSVVGALWYFCLKRRKHASGSSDASTAVDSSRNVMMWLRGHRAEKRLTLTESRTATTAVSPELEDGPGSFVAISPMKTPPVRYEMGDTQVSELFDTSPPAELHDTGFTPVAASQRNQGYFGSDASYSPTNRSLQPSEKGFSPVTPPQRNQGYFGPDASYNPTTNPQQLSDTAFSPVTPPQRNEGHFEPDASYNLTNNPQQLSDTAFSPVTPPQRNPGYFGPNSSYNSTNTLQQARPSAVPHPNSGSPTAQSSIDGPWFDAPGMESAAQASTGLHIHSAGEQTGIQELQHAVPEEAEMKTPVSPEVASERIYSFVMSPASSRVSPLQRTESEENESKRHG
ncbi:hypothetical protein QQS21_012394 [Conoideocrella luteorostrata]|uniref:Galactose oxidase/kelch, beta-propeller n=1 Tax=Conoideocrella luteorostrata TaxID=1105319 RepID=A0AAJ0FMF0_9HYPO|nr:hypothetical protein QQS21_012394 [Conoideocrella luteorostrata]